MSRDGPSSGLFDGFQIFGKTDSSFSLSKDDSRVSHGNHGNHGNDTRMTHSMYNFHNNGNHTVDPEQASFSPPQSLPARSQDQRNAQPSRQRLSSLPSTEERNSPTNNQQNKPQKNKHKTSPHQEKPPSLFRSDHLESRGSDPDLSPLQKVHFTRHSPPPITSPEAPSPHRHDFFLKSLQDSEELERTLSALTSSHTKTTAQLKSDIMERETQLQSILHTAVQRLRDKLQQEAMLADFNTGIEAAIAASDYDQAEMLKRIAEGYPVIIIPFSLPRNSTLCREVIEGLNKARKSHIDALKSHCVQVKEFGVRFDSTSKKIDTQCINKVEKGNQEFVSMETGLQCRKQHLEIDQDYHNKQVLQLEAEKQTLQEEFIFHYKDQDEQLTEVRSEIQQLEEKLALLRTKEKTILEEKRKLDSEKISNDASVKRQLAQLESEREELDVKSATIDRDYKLLNEKRKNFTNSKSKLDQITTKLSGIQVTVEQSKALICESISLEECCIVNDVQAAVNVDLSDTLVIPAELETVIKEIGDKERLLEEYSQTKYSLQKAISALQSEQGRVQGEVMNCKMLKQAAVKVRSYAEAGELSKKQSELEDRLQEVCEGIEREETSLATVSEKLEKVSTELGKLKVTAEEKQKVFDTDSFEVIKEKLKTTAEMLRGLSESSSVTKQLVEADVRYMCHYLKLIHSRYPNLVLDCEGIISEYGEERGEGEEVSERVEKLKKRISEAVQGESYELADELNKELISLEM